MMKLTDAPSCTCKPDQVGHLPECPWGAWMAKYEAEGAAPGLLGALEDLLGGPVELVETSWGKK
jgi:hypothetical protein